MAGGARPAVGAHTLEKRAGFIDAAANGAVRFGGAAGFLKRCSVGNKVELLSTNRAHSHQHRDSEKNPLTTMRLY